MRIFRLAGFLAFAILLTSVAAAMVGDGSLPASAATKLTTPTDVVTNSATTGPPELGTSVTFTASVAGPSGSKTPTGKITWLVSGSGGATACKTSKTALSAGKATCAITVSSAGTYVVSDTYGGDTTYSGVTSATDTLAVAQGSAVDVVSDSATASKPATLGGSVTFTATLTGPSGWKAPTGKITWSVSGTAGVTACKTSKTTLTAGVATCVLTTSGVGTYAVSDTYGGDTLYTAVSSNTELVTVAGSVPTSIPVLDWHELNNGCASTLAVCNGPDVESVSTAQLTAELSYLVSQGYHTVTPAQYEAWTEGSQTPLPTNPILLVADNGIEGFLAGAQPILQADGFTMAVAVVTGFADGAGGVCTEPAYESGCPGANEDGNWDATWAQLAALSPSVYNFIVESGTGGHFYQTYDPNCAAFYACKVPGETDAAYEARVESDLSAGQSEIISKLGASRFTAGVWVVPYSNDGYTACTQTNCTPQTYDGPAGWLTSWTAQNYPVAFVEDAFRNGVQNERFRIDVQGWMTESTFESTLTSAIAAGDFTLTHTAPVLAAPTAVVTDSSGSGSATLGGSVTFTATLAGPAGAPAPTGNVTWTVSGTAGATGCTTSTSALNAGTATCAITVSGSGTYVVSAAYGGDQNYTSATSSPDTVTAPPSPPPTSTNPVAAIPVISMDSVTMTPTQVEAELAYLQASGDHTIAAAAYVSWAESNTVALPSNPILLTVTGGNESFLAAISPYLVNDGYSAVDFVSTAQADLGGSSATWAQLAALTPSAWQFSFSSGANGGTLVPSDPSTCDVYYACEATGEGDSAYQSAVMNDIGAGRLELDNQLWMQTVNDFMWSAPFGDAGQAGQEYNGPAGWLSLWASYVFPVVFVSGGASGDNQHNALDLNGSTTEAAFESTLSSDEQNGTFNG
jgi:hypothetical protein